MIKKFNHFISENKNSEYLFYYAFDFDDNLLFMPTVIHMEEKDGNSWEPMSVSTLKYAEVRNSKNWRITNNSFSEFGDIGPRGDSAFLDDVKKSLSMKKYGPSWGDFIECITSGCLFAIITARGHESNIIRESVEWVIDNFLRHDQIDLMYNNLIKFAYFFKQDKGGKYDKIIKGRPSKNILVVEYLNDCDFVGVTSPSISNSNLSTEELKEEALTRFKDKVDGFARSVGMHAKIGFSDDDPVNVKHIEDLIDNLQKERFPNIKEFIIKSTYDPLNIKMKKRIMETSNQTTGMESSVLKFTDFGNMTGQLYPQGPDQRQDDFANQFKRQTKYLTKTSKEILGKKRRKKRIDKNKLI